MAEFSLNATKKPRLRVRLAGCFLLNQINRSVFIFTNTNNAFYLLRMRITNRQPLRFSDDPLIIRELTECLFFRMASLAYPWQAKFLLAIRSAKVQRVNLRPCQITPGFVV
ncbi:hypothetical protein B1H58_02195 [Pantoea alhagi]|uniref:Uncharacterized protein n=1 Tax=Pantoea alhagi TaxID=1891675 RepID=A0A1W6B1I0_9GAMM|nr:hypothetical protein [Pantoea alhagi]ARJ40924.1 hypothetical protein B1H58_02195 [Pantoea alhagi]